MDHNKEQIKETIREQQQFFEQGKTKDISFRINQLKKLQKLITENEDSILEALKSDMGKAYQEGYLTELVPVLEEIKHSLNHIRSWSKTQKVKTSLLQGFAQNYILPEPYGSVLIMGPWNYPFHLIFAPLVGAIAAGNCAVVKPSEFTPHTSSLIKELGEKYFPANFISVIEGEKETSQFLLEENFDYIFFTGSTQVGKIVMKYAAENLTPVTLELGGKSPCIVNKDIEVEQAASKIIWGKFVNAGQTCIAPDYLYVHKEIKSQMVEALQKSIEKFYGDNPQKSRDYPRIINQRHFERLTQLIREDLIVHGGEFDSADLYIAPTLIDNVSWEDHIMQEEIFGPILPIIEYEKINEVIRGVKSSGKPLALYLFTNDSKTENTILRELSFGGGTINNVFTHFTSLNLPFGGVGNSGMGAYHGKASFDTFTHYKSISKNFLPLDAQSLLHPPYSENKLSLIKKALRLRS